MGRFWSPSPAHKLCPLPAPTNCAQHHPPSGPSSNGAGEVETATALVMPGQMPGHALCPGARWPGRWSSTHADQRPHRALTGLWPIHAAIGSTRGCLLVCRWPALPGATPPGIGHLPWHVRSPDDPHASVPGALTGASWPALPAGCPLPPEGARLPVPASLQWPQALPCLCCRIGSPWPPDLLLFGGICFAFQHSHIGAQGRQSHIPI